MVEPLYGQREEPSLRTPGTDPIKGPIPRLLNEIDSLEHPIVLILDDYHWITDPICQRSIELLIEREAKNLSLAVSSRSDPQLPLGRLRASGELLELRASDLSLTLEETARLLNVMLDLNLSDQAVSILHERTEGWPAGLYLAYLSLRTSSDHARFIEEFGGSSRHVADYLSEVVLENLDDRTREFMLATSVLERLSGPLCDAVTGRADSAGFLAQLERSNSFLIPLDDRREWYRYHRLFSELLQDDLRRRSPDLIPELHRRASSWFEQAGDHGAAIRHAAEANDLDLATDLVCNNYLATIEWGGFRTITAWLEAFPRGWVVAHPQLSIVEAWMFSFLNRREEAETALANATAVEYEGPLPDGASSIDASVVLIRAAFPWSDVGRMLTAAREAHRLEGREGSIWRVTVHVQLGWGLCLAGRFEEARPYLETAVRLAPMANQWLDLFGALCSLAWVALEADDLPEAERWAREGLNIVEARQLRETAPGGWAYATLGAVLAQSGHSKEADALLERGIDQLRGGAQPLLLIQALVTHALVRRALRHNEDARKLVSEARAMVRDCRDPGILGERVEFVSHLVAHGPGAAQPSLELTEREFEVLRLLEKGLSQREIALTLFLSFNTIHSHARSIYRKLDASSRAEAILRARERGLI